MSRPGYRIYEDEMILKGHGFPVWFGDPYGEAEIKIGDIGYMSEGMFVHVMNCNFSFNKLRTTPVDFKWPIYSHSLKQLGGGGKAGVSGPAVDVNSQISFTSSRNTCAMLNVEEGVADYTRCSGADKEAVGKIFLQNAREWIAEAVEERRIASNLSIERLILVTGFYKSANWEAAAFSSSSSTGDLSFTINISQAGGGISINWDSVQHLSPDYSTGHRHPPDSNSPQVLGARGDITHGTNNPAGSGISFEKCCHQHADRTQCIFLRGFRIYERLVAKDQVVELVPEESKPSYGQRIIQIMKSNRKTSKPPSDQSGQRSSSAYDSLEPIEEFPDTNFCDQLYDTIAAKKFMENNSDYVLVHDDELIGILERDAEALDSEPGSSSVVRHGLFPSDWFEKSMGKPRDLDSGLTVLRTSRDAASKATIGRSKEKLERDAEALDSELGSSSVFPYGLFPSGRLEKSMGRPRDLDSGLTVLQTSRDATIGRSKEKGHQETTHEVVEQFMDPVFILRGHTNTVWSVAFSPDGKRVVSGSGDKTVRLWDVETGKPVGVPFQGHSNWIRSVAFSPDGKSIVSGSDDKTVRIWDAETGKPVGEPFRGHTGYVHSVAFSPDGKSVVSGSVDETVRIWNVETGKPVGEPFQGHNSWIRSVAFSRDGKSVVSGSTDRTVRIWDVKTGKPVGEPFEGHNSWITSVAFSPDGKRVVSGSVDQTVRMWDAETGKPLGEPFRGHTKNVNSVAFSPDGRRIVSGSDDRTVRIWDAKTEKLVRKEYVPEAK